MARRWLAALLLLLGSALPSAQTPTSPASALDFATFRDWVQPLLLDKRPGLARCYVCQPQGTPFRLERMAEGRTAWTDEETRRNFAAIQRLVIPGKPKPVGCC